MVKIKGWIKYKDTKNKEAWHHTSSKNNLVSVYPSKAYGGKIDYVFFRRMYEPRYVDDDVYGKSYFSKDFKTFEDAKKNAIKYMRMHPNG